MSHEAIISTALRIDPFGADGTLYKLASNSPETLAAFVAAFVADEREACARTCEGISQMASSNAPVLCAMKIRARSRHAALTAPAAEVPEAMGDAEIDAITRAQWGEQIGVMYQAHRACARAVIASRDAQWQSTRLRGCVPDGLIDYLKHMRATFADGPMSHAPEVKAQVIAIDSWVYQLTAAPQAPAAALDAVVVRDACKLRYTPDWKAGADGLPYQASNFACKTCGYVGKHDTHPGCKIAAMSTQAGKGGTE